ncbi:MAG: T9SS type A sorting domain-containing protein, partial [Bacteroidota bacterium]
DPFQPLDEPLYDGTQNNWVYESMDLTDYIGQDIHIQFALLADGGVTEDGFYFDDLQVGIYEEGDSISNVQSVLMADWVEVYPNPVQTDLAVKIANQEIGDLSKSPVRFRMYNTLGVTVLERSLNQRITEISMSPLANGLYWYQIEHDGIWSQAQRLSIQR